jgi:PAS domain S-box-containing protein
MNGNPTSKQDARDAGDRLLAAHASEDPFAAAFKATRMPMLITDPRQPDNPIIFCNRAFCELTGYDFEEIIGRNCRFLQGEKTEAKAISNIRDAVRDRRDISVDILNYRKDGSTFWNALFISPVYDATGEPIYFFASQLDFTNIKSKEAELAAARHMAEEKVGQQTRDLKAALDAKTILVHEVDHRVKNNLLTIASIVKLQARKATNDIARQTLRSVLNRVEALSTVQRKLFVDDDIGRFDVADFARDLVTDLLGALKRDDISITLDLSPVYVPAVKASPLALIVNELIGDAVRRGLSDGGGEIAVTVKRLNGHFLIRVADTTTPISLDPDAEDFSRMLVETCARQLDAKIERDRQGHQTIVEVTLMVNT